MKKLILCLVLLLAATGVRSETIIQNFNLEDYKGKVVYLDFWASWCIPCKRSFPWLNEMQAKYKEDLVVIGINVDAERSLAEKFLQEIPAEFTIYFDQQAEWPKKLKLAGFPAAAIYNRQGDQVDFHIGFYPAKKDEYESTIQRIINQ